MKSKNETSTGEVTKETSVKGRIAVSKTFKLYIGGQFPRTESGRYLPVQLIDGTTINTCHASGKDYRNAVVAARSAVNGWSSRSAYNRSQILYRMAEMLEGRKMQLATDLIQSGLSSNQANLELDDTIDRIVYYAGWCDKYTQVFSTVNPVATPHFNFSVPEPMGVVGIVYPSDVGLLSLVSHLMPVLAGANTAVLLLPPEATTWAINFAEVLETSDLPAGVVNVLTGLRSELIAHFASHLDVNAVIGVAGTPSEVRELQSTGAAHILRVVIRSGQLHPPDPYQIMDTQEVKTTWHPVGK
ncbi:MAG: aldehyde dehydrogenase family protein [Saprospiraceae bacterium]|nr:aldehyde dehydrogenase family protein [Saprospiraceae bacterium]